MGRTIVKQVAFGGRRGRRRLREAAPDAPVGPVGRVPRVARLLALAHRFEELVRTGAVRNYAELAAVGSVTRARISQIIALLGLAPDIQEELLFMPRVERGRDPIQMHHLLALVRDVDWRRQRAAWAQLKARLPK